MMKKADELILSIPDARVILGALGASLSDDEVRALVTSMDELAILFVDMFKVQKSTQKN